VAIGAAILESRGEARGGGRIDNVDSTAAPPQRERPLGAADEGADVGVSSIDLIIELYKRDVDRTLIVEQLKKTPAQRAADLERFCEFVGELRRAEAKARSG
jgi:hypothetical protein